jgi:hypothetical protein
MHRDIHRPLLVEKKAKVMSLKLAQRDGQKLSTRTRLPRRPGIVAT